MNGNQHINHTKIGFIFKSHKFKSNKSYNMAKLSKTVMEDIEDVMSKYDRVGDKKIEVNDIVNILRALGKVYI